MKVRNKNIFSMQRAVVSFNETVPASIKGMMPNYEALILELADKNTQIGTLSGKQSSSQKGYKENKSETKETLITKVMTIVYATKAFALAQKNNVLLAQTEAIVKSKLQRMRDSKTADTAQEMITIATGIQTNLNPYGITVPVLQQATELLATFRAELAIPRNKIAERKLITAQIETLFKEADAILYNLDTLVNVVADREPAFKEEYFTNRKIINYHGSKLSVRGYIKDADGNPIQKVTVTTLNGKRETKTSAKGYFAFKNLPLGIDTLIFEKVQFNEFRTTVGIVKGERVELNIILENTQSQSGAA